MFEYFPDNYGWSLSFMLALGMGAEIAELDLICSQLRAIASTTGPAADDAWLTAWADGARTAMARAHNQEAHGHRQTAARTWLRAAAYSLLAERQVAHKTENSLAIYNEGLAAFRNGINLGGRGVEFVEVPFERTSMPALFIPALRPEVSPCVIHFDGLDVMKEIIYLLHCPRLADGRISMLICDHPGVGEALRLRNLHATPRTEEAAGACVDYLESRGDVDMRRTGIMALSLGGYYAPRAAAREPRLKFCAAWGANWDARSVVEHCLVNQTGSVSLLDQLRWVLGVSSDEEVWEMIDQFSLEPIIGDITCPILILHGENDRQVPVTAAYKAHEGATSSKRSELVIIPRGQPGCEHCQIDSADIAISILQDWVVDVTR